jgi:putative spermidine/putrescine transport system substrate-binding protein
VSLAGNPDIETVVPVDGRIAGVYVQAISAYAPHPNAAKLWMEFLYSDEGQILYAEGYCHPIRFEAMSAAGTIPAEVAEQLPSTEGALFPSIEDIDAAIAAIQEGWPSVVGVQVTESPGG